eukprot:1141772-Pelagomonas_calceolata.AAC.4
MTYSTYNIPSICKTDVLEEQDECGQPKKLLCNTNPAETAKYLRIAASRWCWQMLAQLLADALGS